MKNFRFRLSEDDSDLIEYLNKKTASYEFNDYVRDVLRKAFDGGFSEVDSENADAHYKKWRAMKMEFDAKIKEKEFKYMENFGKRPSFSGEKAIESNTAQEVSNEVTQYFHIIPDKFSSNSVELQCLVSNECNKFQSYIDNVKIDMLRHLTNFHKEVVMKQ